MTKIRINVCRNCFARQKFLSVCIGVFFSLAGFSQQNRSKIEGLVVDEKSKEPLIGATVFLSSEKTGAVSDENGFFVIYPQTFPAILSVTYVGYKSAEVIVEKPAAPLTISLSEDADLLDEVVVIGYGTQRRKELSGAVSSVSQEQLKYSAALSVDALLSGAVAGLNVTQNSGQPGAASSIRIRGGNSIHASNEPLYVIDGVIVYPRSTDAGAGSSEVAVESSINPLASVNPAD
ncbi:MAG: carboxypeptidase-like regulatory domain-containing protein, partial [Tannerella sp.]|nr:carboxypeptidase-like regulatory domain-containing protein [Tannerella sp.]